MSIVTLFVTLIIAGLALWLVNTYIPMDPKVKSVLNVVAVLVLIIWLAATFLGVHIVSGTLHG